MRNLAPAGDAGIGDRQGGEESRPAIDADRVEAFTSQAAAVESVRKPSDGNHPVWLSITHKCSPNGCAEPDVSEARQVTPHDGVSRWWIIGPREITLNLAILIR